MKINFICYLDPDHHFGGGEQITRKILESGRKRGHEIFTLFKAPPSNNYNNDAELNIFWDIFNVPEQRTPFAEEHIAYYSCFQEKPFVYGTGGYEDFCSLGTVPCEGNTDGILCSVNINHPTFSTGGINRNHPILCPAKRRSFLLSKAKLCVMFSKSQVDLVKKITKVDFNDFVCIPPTEGLENYKNLNLNRDINLLSYGGHLEYKGFFNIMKKYPNECPVFIGGGSPDLPNKYNYGKFLGKIPQDQMIMILNRTKKLIHMPRWVEPYGITTIQALLCGCEVEENGNSTVLKDTTIEELLLKIKESETCDPLWNKIEESLR